MNKQFPDDPVTLYVTVKDKGEGISIGSVLVETKLAACANVSDGLTSIFAWEGKIQTEDEALLIVKTRAGLTDRATAEIIRLHSYDCPCVVSLPITGGNQEFINWIGQETRPQP